MQQYEIPILTNSKPLASGDELVVQCNVPTAKAKAKAVARWDDQNRKGSAAKAKAKV